MPNFVCEYCNNSFKTKVTLDNHLRSPPKYCANIRGERACFPALTQVTPQQAKREADYTDFLYQSFLANPNLEEQNPSLTNELGPMEWSALYALVSEDLRKLEEKYDIKFAEVDQKLAEFRLRWGHREEDTNMINEGLDSPAGHLMRLRELYLIKIECINTVLLKHTEDSTRFGHLKSYFAQRLVNNIVNQNPSLMMMSDI